MARLPNTFNPEEHGEMSSFDPLPKGDYNVVIDESEYKKNSKETGHFLKLRRKVTSGEFEGRYIFSTLNLDNPSKVTVEIAQKELADTCRACGLGPVEDSEDLHGIEHTVTLAFEKGKGDNPDGNKITKIKPLEGAASPAKPSGKSAAAKPAKPSGEAEKPRRKRPVFDDDE